MADKRTRSDAEWRAQLTPTQYDVCRCKGTERAFTGEYNDCKAQGTYVCVCCDNPLFSSESKFNSGTGWPSFWSPAGEGSVRTEIDQSHGMARVEVLCDACDAHLGHLFDDGPPPTGLRFCMNSVALKLIPTSDGDS